MEVTEFRLAPVSIEELAALRAVADAARRVANSKPWSSAFNPSLIPALRDALDALDALEVE